MIWWCDDSRWQLTVPILTGWRLLATLLGYLVDVPPAGYASWQGFLALAGGVGESWSAVVDPARV